MTSDLLVRLAERGSTTVTGETWQQLTADRSFWRLVEQNVVTVESPGSERVVLKGGCYVGRASIGNVTLELHPKISGSLEQLLPHATHGAFRSRRASAPANELNELTALLIEQLVDAVSDYLQQGRRFQYGRRKETGSLVAGKLDVTKTMRLRARGMGHRIAFERQILDYATDTNRVLLAALLEAERIGDTIPIPEDVRTKGRRFSQVFSDCRDVEVLFGRRSQLAGKAASLAEGAEDPSTKDLLSLASAVLGHLAPSFDSAAAGTVPRSWFLNLESLFEDAILDLLRSIASRPGHDLSVTHGRENPKPVFPRKEDRYRAEPDIVLTTGSGKTTVGDVKYKDWTETPAQSDLYQLLIHAAAFDGEEAFLVYPSQRWQVAELGASGTGCRVWSFAVDLDEMPRTIGKVLVELGLARSPEIHPAA